MGIVLQFYPNGEFSQGVDTSRQRRDKKRRDEEFKPPLNKERRDEYLRWTKDNAEILSYCRDARPFTKFRSACGNYYTLLSSTSNSCTLQWSDLKGRLYDICLPFDLPCTAFQWKLTPLVHQMVESSEKPPSRKRLEGMTKNMARNIRQGVYLLEQGKGGKDVLSFLTLTLPNLSTEGLALCCQKWDYMVSRFMDWLGTHLKRKVGCFEYVYCTEIQSKRLQSRGEYAPHLHIIFKGRNGKKSPWAVSPRQARSAWGRCIRAVVNEPFNTNALENIQRVRYSAARYLSKYLSKGSTSIPKDAEGNVIETLRTQWGGMARGISRRIQSCTERIVAGGKFGDLAAVFTEKIPDLIFAGYIRYFKRGFIPIRKCELTGMEYGLHVGCGALSTPTYGGGFVSVVEYCYAHGWHLE